MTAPLTYAERMAMARLHALLELLPTKLDKRLSALGITAFEHTLLDALAQQPDRFLRTSELARKTNATLPRISRVVTSLQGKGLVERVSCPEDKRATNIVLTTQGEKTHAESTVLYANAVRELVLEGLQKLPGDGVAQLTNLTYAVLSSLDSDRGANAALANDPVPDCAADPEPECAADPPTKRSQADPVLQESR